MRRIATIVLVLLVVLGVAGVAVDRFMVARTEGALLDAARERADLAEGSDVVIDGFPFLTQVAAGQLAEVRGDAPALVVDGVELSDVRVAVRGVGPEEPYPAERIEINAVVPATTLQTLMADGLPGDGPSVEVADGLVQLGVEVAGLQLTAVVEPVLDDGEIGLRLGEVMAGDASVPRRALDALDDLLSNVRLEIPGLPPGLEPTRLSVEEEGLRVRLEGADVELAGWGV